MAVKYPSTLSRKLNGSLSNSIFAHSQCLYFEGILLSGISDIIYRNIFFSVFTISPVQIYLLTQLYHSDSFLLDQSALLRCIPTERLQSRFFFFFLIFDLPVTIEYYAGLFFFFLVGCSNVSFSFFFTYSQHIFILQVDIVLYTLHIIFLSPWILQLARFCFFIVETELEYLRSRGICEYELLTAEI